jgi:hypothetical protein
MSKCLLLAGKDFKGLLVSQDKVKGGVEAALVLDVDTYRLVTLDEFITEFEGTDEEFHKGSPVFNIRSTMYMPYADAILPITDLFLAGKNKSGFRPKGRDNQITAPSPELTLPIQVKAIKEQLVTDITNFTYGETLVKARSFDFEQVLFEDEPLRNLILNFAGDANNYSKSKTATIKA